MFPVRDEERWWGARSDSIRVGMAYHVKHCSMFVIPMISIFWLVNVSVLDIYQAKIGLLTWFDLQVCNQRLEAFASFSHSLPLKATMIFHQKFVHGLAEVGFGSSRVCRWSDSFRSVLRKNATTRRRITSHGEEFGASFLGTSPASLMGIMAAGLYRRNASHWSVSIGWCEGLQTIC